MNKIKARGKANLAREAARQASNAKSLDRAGFTGGDIRNVADDKAARENYGPRTAQRMGEAARALKRKR